jgi:hypothetical protein
VVLYEISVHREMTNTKQLISKQIYHDGLSSVYNQYGAGSSLFGFDPQIMRGNNPEDANKIEDAIENILKRRDNEFDMENRIYQKLCDFEREAFINNIIQSEAKSSTEEVSRRRKKHGAGSQTYAKIITQEEIDQDIAKIKQITGVYTARARIENKVLKVRGGTFRKNDYVKVRSNSVIESMAISSINTADIVFKRRDGSKFKCALADISDGLVKIYKIRRGNNP